VLRGNAFNELVWLSIVKLVIKSFYKKELRNGEEQLFIKPVNMASILLEQMVSDTHKESSNAFFQNLRECHQRLLSQYLASGIRMPVYKKQIQSIISVEKVDINIPLEEVRAHLCSPSVLIAEHFDIEMKWSQVHQILAIIRQCYEFCLEGAVPEEMFKNKLESIWEESISATLSESHGMWEKYYRPCLSCLSSCDDMHSPIPCEQAHFNHAEVHMSNSRLKISVETAKVQKLLRRFRK
jgi:hypothetical protein